MRESSVTVSPRSTRASWSSSLFRWALQGLWFVVTPLLMSGVFLRYLTPYSLTAGGFESVFARFCREHTLLLGLGLFVALAAFFRYWRALLPGGRYLFVPRDVPSGSGLRKSWAFIIALGATVVFALQLRSRFIQVYEVLGSSMLPAFTPDELLLGRVATYSPTNLPQRGEVVVLRVMVDGEPRDIVKRVLGLPGDHMGMVGNVPVINGWPVPFCDAGPYFSPADESAHTGDPSGRLFMEFVGNEAYLTYQTVFAEPFSEYVVKPGEVFVLGDNRSNSRDSRNFEAGAAHGFPLSAIRAKVTRVLFSRNSRGQLDPASVGQSLDYSFRVEGTDLSMNENTARRCLILRPKDANPPGTAKLSVASAPQ